MLLRNPTFTLVTVITLAIAVGANTAIFSLVNGVLLRPYPYSGGEDLVTLWTTQVERGVDQSLLSYPDFVDYRDSGIFADLAAYTGDTFTYGADGEPVRVEGARVSADLFEVLGVAPLRGRTFPATADRPGGPQVVLLHEAFWRQHFSADPGVVGRDVVLDGRPHRVLGVMPRGAEIPDGARLWVPLALDEATSGRNEQFLMALGHLAAGTNPDSAAQSVATLARSLESRYPRTNQGRGARLIPLRDARVGNMSTILAILLSIVGFLLLIGCANVANLLLARGEARSHEIGIRTALGADRTRLLRLLLTESALIALAGGGLGLALGVWGVHRLLHLVPMSLPPWMRFSLDVRMLIFTLAVSVLAAVAFGLLPALRVSRTVVGGGLRTAPSQAGGLRRDRLKRSLVVAELALALALLMGAGLMVRSFAQISAADPGFNTSGVATFTLDLPASLSDDERVARVETLFSDLAALPGVENLGHVSHLPLTSSVNTVDFTLEGQGAEEQRSNPHVVFLQASPEYLATLQVPVLAGRGISAEPEAVVHLNRRAARLFWGDEDPVGRRLKLGGPSSEAPWLTVAGVVGDVHQLGVERPVPPTFFVPFASAPPGSIQAVVRTAGGDPLGLAGALRREAAEVFPTAPLYDLRPMDELVERAVWRWELLTTLFWIFGGLALVLAVGGVYGVLSYSVAQRTREMGIRMAVGASGGDILSLVMRDAGRLVAWGLVVGVPLALGLGAAMASVLYQVRPFDPPTLGAVVLVLVIVALLASFLPARRAVGGEPLRALRVE